MEEYETSFYNFIFEEEDNKELKKLLKGILFHAISVYGCSNGFI